MIKSEQRPNHSSGFTDFIMSVKDEESNWFELNMYDDIYGDNIIEITFDDKYLKITNGSIEEVKNGIKYMLGVI